MLLLMLGDVMMMVVVYMYSGINDSEEVKRIKVRSSKKRNTLNFIF